MRFAAWIGCCLVMLLCLPGTDLQAGAIESSATRESIWSKTLNEWRGVIVRLPDSYHESQQTYPVVYLLDGDAHYYHVAGAAQFMANNNLMPEVIVVAVPNGVMTRSRDLTPPSEVAAEDRAGGGADRFLDFLTQELAPWVRQRYRTASFDILIGHSFGGLFAMHALHTRPESFAAYLALDPSLWYNRKALSNTLPQALGKLDNHHFRYLYTAGTPINEPLKEFSNALLKRPPAGITIRSRPTYAGDDHNNLVHLAIYDGLQQLFAGWSAWPAMEAAKAAQRDPLTAIKDHQRQLAQKYGFTVQLSAKAYIWAAYRYLPLADENAPRDPARAVAILDEATHIYPNLFRNRVFALGEAGRFDEALRVAQEGLNYYSMHTSAGNEFLDLQRQIDALRKQAPESQHAH